MQGMTAQLWKKEDISDVIWSRAPGGCLLRVRQHDKVTINLHGFNTGDEARLKEELSSFLDIELRSQEMDAAGHNWGQLQVHGSSLAFEVWPLTPRTPLVPAPRLSCHVLRLYPLLRLPSGCER